MESRALTTTSTEEINKPLDLWERTIRLLVWLYLILKPFYFWQSGLPQVADLIAVLLIILALRMPPRFSRQGESRSRPVTILLTVSAYFTFVNLAAMFLTNGDYGFLASSLFYIFNVSLAISVYNLHTKLGDRLRRWMFYAIISSILLQSLLLLTQPGTTFRATGQFNNPNQLAYYGLLSACLITFIVLKSNVSTIWAFLGLIGASWLVLSSLSKAAIVALGVLVPGLILLASTRAGRGLRGISVLICGGLMVLTTRYAASDQSPDSELFRRLEQRFGIRQSDDSLAGRGYDRIWENPQNWLFGAGEGGYERFGTGIELHSTLGTIQFAYGAVGSLLFLTLLVMAVRRTGWAGILVLAPLMLFGLTHNGTRNTLLWVILALVLSFASGGADPSQQFEPKDTGRNRFT